MKKIELKELLRLNGSPTGVLRAICREIKRSGQDAVRLDYNATGRSLGLCRRSIKYNVGKLLDKGYIAITDDKKIMVIVELPPEFVAI